MASDDGMSSRDWQGWLIVGGVLAIPTLLIMYTGTRHDLSESERYSRFQSFLMECSCRPSGTGYTPDGVEEPEYKCSRRGGTIRYSDYAQTKDDYYDPRESRPTLICPSK